MLRCRLGEGLLELLFGNIEVGGEEAEDGVEGGVRTEEDRAGVVDVNGAVYVLRTVGVLALVDLLSLNTPYFFNFFFF